MLTYFKNNKKLLLIFWLAIFIGGFFFSKQAYSVTLNISTHIYKTTLQNQDTSLVSETSQGFDIISLYPRPLRTDDVIDLADIEPAAGGRDSEYKKNQNINIDDITTMDILQKNK